MLFEKHILERAIRSNKFTFNTKSYTELENYLNEKIKYINELEKIGNLDVTPLYYFSWISNKKLLDFEVDDLYIITEEKLSLVLNNGLLDNTNKYFQVPNTINKGEDM